LVKYKKYSMIYRLLSKTYFYTTNTENQEYGTFEVFRHYIPHLDEQRNNRLNLNRISVTADLLKERADYPSVSLTELINADLLLYISSVIVHPKNDNWWFPRLSIYYKHGVIRPLGEMVSKERANDIIHMFGCSNIMELQDKLQLAIEAVGQRPRGFDSFNYNIPRLSEIFPKDIASLN
jgi:hypothetical protein